MLSSSAWGLRAGKRVFLSQFATRRALFLFFLLGPRTCGRSEIQRPKFKGTLYLRALLSWVREAALRSHVKWRWSTANSLPLSCGFLPGFVFCFFFWLQKAGLSAGWCPALQAGAAESGDVFSTKGISTQGFAQELRILAPLTGSGSSLPGVCGCCGALRPRYKRLVDNIFPEDPEVNQALLHASVLWGAAQNGSREAGGGVLCLPKTTRGGAVSLQIWFVERKSSF